MAATGTIALKANSLTVTGSGTKFTTEAQVGGAFVTYIGNVPYTFVVGVINSDTSIALTANYQGSTVSGQSFSLIDRSAYTAITAELGARTAQAIRGLNYDKANWQQILTGSGNVTINVPDGSQYTGPSWLSLANSLSEINTSLGQKANQSDVTDALSEKANTSDLGGLAGKGSVSRNELAPELKRNLFACGATEANSQGAGVFYFNNTPFGWNTQYGICAQFSNLTSSDPGAGQGKWQHYLAMGTNGDIIYVTNINESYSARKLYSTTNTSTNSNGALVPASPIIRVVNGKNCTRQDLLGAENKEYAWQSDYGLSNAEAEGCSVTKLDTGKYLINGATSLATDLWQVMDCGNGQGRIIAQAEAVETESGIEVHCYKQKYSLTDDGDLTVGRGDLIDIPDNTWIDVRLKMPNDSIWNKKQIQPTQDNAPTS